jgi:hypothetical protein
MGADFAGLWAAGRDMTTPFPSLLRRGLRGGSGHPSLARRGVITAPHMTHKPRTIRLRFFIGVETLLWAARQKEKSKGKSQKARGKTGPQPSALSRRLKELAES